VEQILSLRSLPNSRSCPGFCYKNPGENPTLAGLIREPGACVILRGAIRTEHLFNSPTCYKVHRRDTVDNRELQALNHARSCQQCWIPKEHICVSLNGSSSRSSREDTNLVVGRLAGVFISNGIADVALFGLEDFFDFSFAVGDVVMRTADGSIFDEIAGLSEPTIQDPAPL